MQKELVSPADRLLSEQSLCLVCLNSKGEWLAALPNQNRVARRIYHLYLFLSEHKKAESFHVLVEFSSLKEIDEATPWKPLAKVNSDQLVKGCLNVEVPARAAHIRIKLDPPNTIVPAMMLSDGIVLTNQEAYDRWATMRFCQVWDLPYDKKGRVLEHSRPPTQNLNYSSIRCPSSAYGDCRAPCPTALHIRSLGRFSNALFQVAQACELASVLKINKLYISPSDQASQLFGDQHQIEVSGSSIQILITNPPTEDIVLEGTFFYSRHHMTWFNQGNRRYEFIQKIKYSLGLLPQVPLPKSECVIHIRSGDIYSDKPHPNYAQPPLAYYKKVIEHAKPAYVHLVYEDERSPIIEPLQRYLTGNKIGYRVQSSDVRTDIKCLLKGSIVVAGRGTFVPGILAISDAVEVLYTYDAPLESVVLPDVSNIVIDDTQGIYRHFLLNHNWKNKWWQRQLMRCYPVRFLRPVKAASARLVLDQ